VSVYDEMYDCIESARSTDACEYNVYSEMFDLIAEAEAENEKLRGRVFELEELTDHRRYIPQEWYAALQVENAKLRALVRDMWHELDAATQYDAGGVRGIVSEFADSMRDLGIEV